MKLFIKPFLTWLKKAIALDIDADLSEATLTLTIMVSLAGKVLFEESWSWTLPSSAIEADPDVMEEVPVPGAGVHRIAPIRLPKVRVNPRALPRFLSRHAAKAPRQVR